MSPEQRYKLNQAQDRTPSTNTFLFWPLAFVAVVMLCREVTQENPARPLLQPVVYHTSPGQDASTLNLILDWF